ncbi:hypothetical protein LJB42_002086 [Komagataella kurtzmanii]|nr:hypothetical protein LJB42_002086 [Komagataella kurtzmanii]
MTSDYDPELEAKLAKIRVHASSKLENQKHMALILSAVEENIQEQNNPRTAVTYFVSFMSLLDRCIQDDIITDNALALSTAYFLDLLAPLTPKSLLKSNFAEILTKIAPAITNEQAEAPLIRSSIGVLETLLLSQDLASWKNASSMNISPKRGLMGLLELTLDSRPKVRRRAQEAISKILSNPPPGPSVEHPGSLDCANFATNKLIETMRLQKSKRKSEDRSANSAVIHCLQLISQITNTNSWPNVRIELVCDLLLEVAKASDQFLITNAFQAFENLFNSMSEDELSIDKFDSVIKIILDLKPSVNDTHLAAAWLAVVAKASTAYSNANQARFIKKFPIFVQTIIQFFSSESENICISTSQCLIAIITEGIHDDSLLISSKQFPISPKLYENVDESITQLAEAVNSLLSVKYNHCLSDILNLISCIFIKLRSRANPDFLNCLEIVGAWRSDEQNFQYIQEADNVIGSAIGALGPEAVLSVLPLNLDSPKKTGRAWLLPLLRDNVRNANLSYFKTQLAPLIKFFEQKIASSTGDSVHAKIFATIIDQIWSLLPHFCDLPTDMPTEFDDEFASELASLMYSKVELRVTICQAFKSLVESNLVYSSGALSEDKLLQQQFPKESAAANIEVLSKMSSKLLSVLFNVFSQTVPELRGFILETIQPYLQISSQDDLVESFNKVCLHLNQALEEDKKNITQAQLDGKKLPNQKLSTGEIPRLSVTMMDLIVVMVKYIPESSYNALLSIFNQTVTIDDSLIQKRSYRIIARLLETESGKNAVEQFLPQIESLFIDSAETTHIPAKAARFQALLRLIQILPDDDLYFIPSILSEVIITIKDPKERSRLLAYDVLKAMAFRMQKGGVVITSKVPEMDPDTPNTQASLSEYFTMCSAGLAGSTAHMIGATINAISYLFYEFRNDMDRDLLNEVSSTVELFLTSKNREIVNATLGFVKVSILTLPSDIVKENLPNLLANLMRWSHEHRGNFKTKVKHMVERLIRKFGADLVEQAIPEEDRKLIANIKKTKRREKRKAVEGDNEPEKSKAKGKTGFISAFEDAIYNDSEDSEDDGDEDEPGNGKSRQYITESKDEPLDLLDQQTLARISSSKPKKFSKKDLAAKAGFRTNQEGKFVINNKIDDDLLDNKASGIDAYVEAVRNGPVKGQRNKLKFLRGKKANNDEDFGDESDEEPAATNKNMFNKIRKPKQKFKAGRKL